MMAAAKQCNRRARGTRVSSWSRSSRYGGCCRETYMALRLRAYIKLVFVTELSYFHPNVFLITVPLPTTLFLPPWCLRCEMPRGFFFPHLFVTQP